MACVLLGEVTWSRTCWLTDLLTRWVRSCLPPWFVHPSVEVAGGADKGVQRWNHSSLLPRLGIDDTSFKTSRTRVGRRTGPLKASCVMESNLVYSRFSGLVGSSRSTPALGYWYSVLDPEVFVKNSTSSNVSASNARREPNPREQEDLHRVAEDPARTPRHHSDSTVAQIAPRKRHLKKTPLRFKPGVTA